MIRMQIILFRELFGFTGGVQENIEHRIVPAHFHGIAAVEFEEFHITAFRMVEAVEPNHDLIAGIDPINLGNSDISPS